MRQVRRKVCRTCKAEKPLRQFYRHPDGTDGHRGECKDCTCAERREAYRLKREEKLAYQRSYRASDRGRAVIRAYRRSLHGRTRQREAQRFWRGSRRLEQRA